MLRRLGPATPPSGWQLCSLAMLERRGKGRRVTLGPEQAYGMARFVDAVRNRGVTLHIPVDSRMSKPGSPGLIHLDQPGAPPDIAATASASACPIASSRDSAGSGPPVACSSSGFADSTGWTGSSH